MSSPARRHARTGPGRRWRDLLFSLLGAIALLIPMAGPALADQSGGTSSSSQTEVESNPRSEQDLAPEVTTPEGQVATPRAVDPNSLPEYFKVQKTVDSKSAVTLEPGQTFEYKIQVSCSEVDCLNAQVVDILPDLTGFKVQGLSAWPQSIASELTWQNAAGEQIAQPQVLKQGDQLNVAFRQPLPGGKVGFPVANTFFISISLKVPSDFSPLDPRNNEVLVNVAKGQADNARPVEAEADITVEAKRDISVAIDKTWNPSQQPFGEGNPSIVDLTVTNTSNVPVDTLRVTDPSPVPASGLEQLTSDNPFNEVDFVGFGGSTFPAGADLVQVDAYTQVDGLWQWVSGVPSTDFVLPEGVVASEVGGLQFTFTGEQIANGAGGAAHLQLEVAQRATHRSDQTDLSLDGYQDRNLAEAQTQVTVDDQVLQSPVATDDANFHVTPPVVETTVVKNFDPDRVSQGVSTTGTIVATNSGSPVARLTVSDRDFFDGGQGNWQKRFGGFTTPITFPNGAEAGSITYYLSDGTTQVFELFEDQIPEAPAQNLASVTGFELNFNSGSANRIASGAEVRAQFEVKTNPDRSGDQGEVRVTNRAESTVTSANGTTDSDEDTAVLEIVQPAMAIALDKQVVPNITVLPGQNVIVQLGTTAKPSVGTGVKDLQITDQANPEVTNDFWNAFNVNSIRPTQIPAGYNLQVAVLSGDVWTELTLPDLGDVSKERLLVLDEADFTAALAAVGLTSDDVTGITFDLTAADGVGIIGNLSVKPNVGFEARAQLRTGEDIPAGKTTYQNQAMAQGTGHPPVGPDVPSGPVEDQGTGSVEDPSQSGGPGGSTYLAKKWGQDWVLSLTGMSRNTTITWNVDSGHNQVVVSDPGSSIGPVSQSVFNAFNLTGISGLAVNNTPYTNGWYLKWDRISQVELYNSNTGAWEVVPAPEGSWQRADRSFKGYNLNADQQGTTTGVRLTVVPDDAARAASTDPLAPRVGSGVTGGLSTGGANNSTNRAFVLNWEIRDRARQQADGNPWVTGQRAYNVTNDEEQPVKALVRNTTSLSDENSVLDTAWADITILDPVANVKVAKSANPTNLVVPKPGSVAPENYPTTSFTVTANNAAGEGSNPEASKASLAQWVRLIDPNWCQSTEDCLVENTAEGARSNPWLNLPAGAKLGEYDSFNWLNLTKLTITTSKPEQINQDATLVYLLRYQNGELVPDEGSITMAQANALSREDLADVVGYAVVFTSNVRPGPSGGGGMISPDNNLKVVVDTQLRSTERIDGSPVSVKPNSFVSNENTVFAQGIRPEGVGPNDHAGANSEAQVRLSGETVDVRPTKTIEPEVLYEPTSDETVQVRIGADQGSTSNASPWKVVLEDYQANSSFWNLIDLDQIQTVAAPKGADLVQIDAHVFGADWVEGTPQPVAGPNYQLPASVVSDQVDGLRFTFTKSGPVDEDGKGPIFSATNNPAWQANVLFTANLRETARSGGDVDFPHEPVANHLVAQSFGKLSQSARPSTQDDLRLEAGSHELAIGKLTNEGQRQVSGGATVPWDIVVKNQGTGFITLTEVVDKLPALLDYTGESASSGPGVSYTLPEGMAEPQMSLSENGKTLSFTWADNSARLRPGQEVQIRVWLELQPGIFSGQLVYNTADVVTKETLDRVTPYQFTEADGDKYLADITVPAELNHDASTKDYISVFAGSSIQVYKGVSGSLPGAVNSVDPTQICGTFVGLDGKSYYRSPCVANSMQEGTDTWSLRVANTGTTGDFPLFWIYDQLPTPGDSFLVSGDPRGSQFRPVLTGRPQVLVNGQVDEQFLSQLELQVTYAEANVCRNSWTNYTPALDGNNSLTGGPCTQSGEQWQVADDSTNWEQVTGLRFRYLNQEAQDNFRPGAIVDIYYQTKNVLASTEDPAGAERVIPVDPGQRAWNQFGVNYMPAAGQGRPDKVAPNLVGVQLLAGSLEVNKTVTGPASAYAPDAFTASVSCISGDGVPLQFKVGDQVVDTRQVTLTRQEDGSYAGERISGIPVGASCTVSEDGSLGQFGEADRTQPQTVTITEADTEFNDGQLPANPVPELQVVDLTNDYQWAGLSVTKKVDTLADLGNFGPFDFELTCQTSNGTPVTFGEEDRTTFTLSRDETWTAPEATIPWGSVCQLQEVDRGGAAHVVVTGTNVTDTGAGSAQIKVTGTEEDPTAAVFATVTNEFPAGALVVTKVVDGAGAETYGSGKFDFTAVCQYNGETVLDEAFSLAGGENQVFGIFPAGTECQVLEHTTGGATSAILDGEEGKVVISGPTEEQPVIGLTDVTATNPFDTGSLRISKVRDGAGAEKYGAGPFEAQVACSYQADGERVDIDLPADGQVTLSAENNYQAVFDNLIVGAECSVVETQTGGAHESTIDPEGGLVTIDESEQEVQVQLTNTFHVGDLEVVKQVAGDGAAQKGAGPFEVQVTCLAGEGDDEWQLDLPEGGVYSLSKQNDYRVRLDDLYAGARCTVEETDNGGADRTVMDPKDGVIEVGADQTATVTITNYFDPDELADTGANVARAAAWAVLLLGGGGLALWLASRRRRPGSGQEG